MEAGHRVSPPLFDSDSLLPSLRESAPMASLVYHFSASLANEIYHRRFMAGA